MVDSIKRSIDEIIKNRSSTEHRSPSSVRMKIWTGPGITQDNQIFQCRGYYKDKHIVYAAPKHKFAMLIKGSYSFSLDWLSEVSALLSTESQAFTREYLNRHKDRSTPDEPKN